MLSFSRLLLAAFFSLLLLGCAAEEKEPPPKGEIGESCRVRNDCEEHLACLRGTCLPRGVGLKPTGKECYRIQCEQADDCCEDFSPHAECDTFKAACDADPDDCLSFVRLCKCQQGCEDNLCITLAPACIKDDHCEFGPTHLDYCVSGRCVECRTDTDCGTDGSSCVEGSCASACLSDTDCPMLHSCDEGRCIETGCSSNRECAFLLGDDRAICDAKECRIACSSDLECDRDRFEACDEGQCVFVGCSSNLECRDHPGQPSELYGRIECR